MQHRGRSEKRIKAKDLAPLPPDIREDGGRLRRLAEPDRQNGDAGARAGRCASPWAQARSVTIRQASETMLGARRYRMPSISTSGRRRMETYTHRR